MINQKQLTSFLFLESYEEITPPSWSFLYKVEQLVWRKNWKGVVEEEARERGAGGGMLGVVLAYWRLDV